MKNSDKEVLKANESFYQALRDGDFQSMDSLWANQDEVAVVHPGWSPLHGREAVMESWRRIFGGGSTSEITCSKAEAHILGNVAYVVCSECFPEGELVATNIFKLEGEEWKMVHHQGGVMTAPVIDSEGETIH